MGLENVYAQKIRYHRVRGETGLSIMLFIEEIVREIKKWKQKYERIILMMDANEYLNKRKLLRGLTQLVIKELVKERKGQDKRYQKLTSEGETRLMKSGPHMKSNVMQQDLPHCSQE